MFLLRYELNAFLCYSLSAKPMFSGQEIVFRLTTSKCGKPQTPKDRCKTVFIMIYDDTAEYIKLLLLQTHTCGFGSHKSINQFQTNHSFRKRKIAALAQEL